MSIRLRDFFSKLVKYDYKTLIFWKLKQFASYINKHTFRFPIGFYSQQGEDKIIYETYYKNNRKKNGVFIEIGAMDGLTISNTKFFEDVLGWKGILIEPVPRMYKRLTKNRPNCYTFNCAVSSKDKAIFIGNYGTAGIFETMAESFKDQWHAGVKKDDCYKVECRPMSDIITETGLHTIDLFSLDVEGGELEVLRTINWETTKIGLFLIELDGHDQEKDDSCRQILKEHGFRFEKHIGINDLWKNKGYPFPNKENTAAPDKDEVK